MAEVVMHPARPDGATAADVKVPEPEGDALDVDGLEYETKKLIRMLDREIGRKWMSFELRLQLEEVEIILGTRGTNAYA